MLVVTGFPPESVTMVPLESVTNGEAVVVVVVVIVSQLELKIYVCKFYEFLSFLIYLV